jgi:signal transduction histidine kinase
MKAILQDVLAQLNQVREAIGRLEVPSADRPQPAKLVSELEAACMQLEEQDSQLQALHQDLVDNELLADIAEVASPMAHEFNNFLNALLLRIAVLEMQLPSEMRPGLEEMRQQGKSLAALVHHWQYYRRRQSGGSTVDLNRVVLDTLQKLCTVATGPLLRLELPDSAKKSGMEGTRVRLELHDGPLAVSGTAVDLQRLCTFLLRNAAAVTPPDARVIVQTARSGGKGLLRVEDAGPAVTPEQLAELFTPYPVRPGTNGLELAACKSIVRRLQGSIAAENNATKGITIMAELPSEQV